MKRLFSDVAIESFFILQEIARIEQLNQKRFQLQKIEFYWS